MGMYRIIIIFAVLLLTVSCVSIDDGGTYEPDFVNESDFDQYIDDYSQKEEKAPSKNAEILPIEEPDKECAEAKEKTKVIPRQIELVLERDAGRVASLTNIIDNLEEIRSTCYTCPSNQKLYLASCDNDPHKALADIITALRVLQQSPSKNINDLPRFISKLEEVFVDIRSCRALCE